MKKTLKSIIAILMILSALLICVSCKPSDKVQKQVDDHLKEKYGDLEFELIGCSQNRSTNGWYVASIRCVDTDVIFSIYLSNVHVSDSYGVEYANKTISKKLLNGPLSEYKNNIESIQWLDIFEDDLEGYEFRSVDASVEYEAIDAKSFYRVDLKNCNLLSSAASTIYDIFITMEASGVTLGESTFYVDVGTHSYRITADYHGIDYFSKNDFIQAVLSQDESKENEFYIGIIDIDVRGSAYSE